MEGKLEAAEKRMQQLEEKRKLRARVTAQYALLRFIEGVVVGRRQACQGRSVSVPIPEYLWNSMIAEL